MQPKKVFNKDGSYRWLIDYYDDKGKRIKKRFKKLSDANGELLLAQTSKENGTYAEIFKKKPEEPPYLFRDLARDYLAAYQGQKSFADKKQIVSVLVQTFGDESITNITFRDLELFRSRREQEPTWCGKTRSVARGNREMSILRHMLNKAIIWGKLENSPFKKGEGLLKKENNERIRYLSAEEARALLQCCSSHLRPIVETALNTGMRKGEILSLKWSQVRDGWIYLEETKSGKGRPVPINDAQTQVFKELLANAELRSAYIFSGNKGHAYRNVQRSFDAACRRAGIYDFRFHDLRHTCARPSSHTRRNHSIVA